MEYKLHHGDSIELLKAMVKMGDRFSSIISDPPYGTINGLSLQGTPHGKVDWDDRIDWKEWFELAFQVTDQIILFGQNPTYAEMILSTPYYKYEYIWVKNNCAQGFHAGTRPLNYTENIAVFQKDIPKEDIVFNKVANTKDVDRENFPLRWYSQQLQLKLAELYNLKGRKDLYKGLPRRLNKRGEEVLDRRLEFFLFYVGTLCNPPGKEAYQVLVDSYPLIKEWDEFLEWEEIQKLPVGEAIENASELSTATRNTLFFAKEQGNEAGKHPTQKPVELMEFLIKSHTNEGDTILDPFMGSGSTGVAALRSKRFFTGIERDETYFKTSKRRMENE